MSIEFPLEADSLARATCSDASEWASKEPSEKEAEMAQKVHSLIRKRNWIRAFEAFPLCGGEASVSVEKDKDETSISGSVEYTSEDGKVEVSGKVDVNSKGEVSGKASVGVKFSTG